MALTFFDYVLSSDCYKVRLLLTFLGLKYDRQLVDVYPGNAQLSADYLAMNPLGQVPALRDGERGFWDTQTILYHLAAHHDAERRWLPADPALFSEVMTWLMFATRQLQAATDARAHDLFEAAVDIGAARRGARQALQVLDDYLVHRQMDGHIWLVGDRATIADIACFAPAALSGDGGVDHDEFPALRRWLRSVRALPNFHTMAGIPEFL